MATMVLLHPRIYAGHMDLACASQVDFGTLTAEARPFTSFKSGGFSEYKPGLKSGTFTLTPYSDFAAGAIDDQIGAATLGTQYPVTVDACPSGTSTVGDRVWFSRGIHTKYAPFDGAVGDEAKSPLEIVYDTAFVPGYLAHPEASRAATGNGTAVALAGPTSSQRLYCALHVTAWSGLTSLTVKVQSDDGSGMASPTDRLTLTAATGLTSQFASTAGGWDTETHHRIVYTIVGTGTCTFTASFGVL